MIAKQAFLFLAMLGILSCTEQTEHIEIDWVLVPGGTFEQGKNQVVISPKGDTIRGFTSPHRIIELSNFYISKHEITVGQFRAFCTSTGRKMPEPPITNAFGKKVYYTWDSQNPMLATWDEALAFSKWAGGRLPTEAEWEYAAKGGPKSLGFTYSGSNDPMEVGWVRENSDSTFHKVGQLKPNELGIYDMTGNVGEWVFDWYNPEMDQWVNTVNPQGPMEGKLKISKGLSWFYATQDAQGNPLKYGIHMPEVRYQSPPETRNDGFGFRIVKDFP